MGLVGDLQEAKALWKGASWPTRGLAVLMVFVTTSSVASLSDIVFAWKGFFLDAVEFYRSWITAPLRGVASSIGLDSYSQLELDFIVLVATLISTNHRIKKWRYDQWWYSCLLVLTAILMGFEAPEDDGFVAGTIAALLICIVWLGIETYRDCRKEFLAAFGPLFLAIIFILIAGAINAGLTKAVE